LELIHQNEARTLAGTGENFGIRGEQIVGANDHVIEGAEVALAKHALDGFEDKSDLAATSESFLVADFAGISGFRNARNGKRAALDAVNVVPVILGSDEFVMAPASEVEQV